MTTHRSTREPAATQLFSVASRGGLLVMLVLLCVVFAILDPVFATYGNAIGIWRTASIAAIMYVGLTWVIASGEIDVSFMEVTALAGMIFASLANAGVAPLLAALAAVVAGVAIGVVNGTMVGLLGFPSLIVTIASGGLARSLAAIIGGGQPIYLAKSGAIGALAGMSLFGLPVIGVFAVLLYACSWYIQEKLAIGHYVYVMAQNPLALWDAGIRTKRIRFGLFIVSATMAAGAGVILAATLASGQPMIGGSFFLDGLTAVFLGATLIRLGQPNIIGTGVGVVILAVLVNGLALIGWPNFAREILKGVLLVIGVIVAVKGGHLPTFSRRRRAVTTVDV
jgi:ribose transport system permease protein